jgi:hypothetical protein
MKIAFLAGLNLVNQAVKNETIENKAVPLLENNQKYSK